MLCNKWYISNYYQFLTPINKSNYTVYTTTQSNGILKGKEQEQLKKNTKQKEKKKPLQMKLRIEEQ